MAVFQGAGSGEREDQFLVAKPGHGRWLASQTGGDQEGIVGVLVERHDDPSRVNGDGRRHVQQIAEDCFSLCPLILASDLVGQETIK